MRRMRKIPPLIWINDKPQMRDYSANANGLIAMSKQRNRQWKQAERTESEWRKRNERSVASCDCGRGVVFRPVVAVTQAGHLDLNAPRLLGREQQEGW